MGVETERKWLLDKLPENADKFPHTEIVQGYLCADPVIRVRRDGDKYYLTYKGRGRLSREEYNLPLNEEAFLKLCGKCDGVLIEKTRYRIPIGENGVIPADVTDEIKSEMHAGSGINLTAEIDVFKGKYSGLIYAEVEFPDEMSAESFQAPVWFEEEVTYKSGYSNAELALGMHGGGF